MFTALNPCSSGIEESYSSTILEARYGHNVILESHARLCDRAGLFKFKEMAPTRQVWSPKQLQ